MPETETPVYTFKRARGAMTNVTRWSSRRETSRRVRMGYRRQKFPGLAADDVQTLVSHWVNTGVITRMPEVTRVDRTLLRLR